MKFFSTIRTKEQLVEPKIPVTEDALQILDAIFALVHENRIMSRSEENLKTYALAIKELENSVKITSRAEQEFLLPACSKLKSIVPAAGLSDIFPQFVLKKFESRVKPDQQQGTSLFFDQLDSVSIALAGSSIKVSEVLIYKGCIERGTVILMPQVHYGAKVPKDLLHKSQDKIEIALRALHESNLAEQIFPEMVEYLNTKENNFNIYDAVWDVFGNDGPYLGIESSGLKYHPHKKSATSTETLMREAFAACAVGLQIDPQKPGIIIYGEGHLSPKLTTRKRKTTFQEILAEYGLNVIVLDTYTVNKKI